MKKLLILLLLLTSLSAQAELQLVKAKSEYTGLSTDTKPSGLAADSKFYETDTEHVWVYDGDSWNRYIDVDERSGAVGSINQEHMMIHDGLLFTVSSRVSIAGTGGTEEFLAVVPAGVYPHFRSISVATDGGPADVDFYEGTVTTVDGTPITPVNNNRNSTNTASTAIYSSPTIDTDGTILEPILIPGNKQSGSFGSDASNEWILKPSTKYMIRITNDTSGAGPHNFTINMFFYEG